MSSDLYRQTILDHARNPRNFGKLAKADTAMHEANLSCGDEVTLYLKYNKGFISEATFEGRGCILCLAGASMLTEKITDKKINDIKKMKAESILKMFGSNITPSRQKCALLAFEALNKLQIRNEH